MRRKNGLFVFMTSTPYRRQLVSGLELLAGELEPALAQLLQVIKGFQAHGAGDHRHTVEAIGYERGLGDSNELSA